jgi:hypothetical protein
MSALTQYLLRSARPLRGLASWRGVAIIVGSISVFVAVSLGLGPWGAAVAILLLFVFLFGRAGVSLERALDAREQLSIEIEPLATSEVSWWPERPKKKVALVSFLVRNRGPSGEFVAKLVSKSVHGIGEEYPQASADLRWQTPNREASQPIGHGLDSRIDVALVAPDVPPIVKFLGPATVWKTVHPEGEEVAGLIDIADVTRDGPPQRVRFTIVTGPSHPVALIAAVVP